MSDETDRLDLAETSTNTINSNHSSSPPDSEFTDEEALMDNNRNYDDDIERNPRLSLISYHDDEGNFNENSYEGDETIASPIQTQDFSFRKSYKRRRDPSLRQGTLSVPFASLNILNSTLGLGFLLVIVHLDLLFAVLIIIFLSELCLAHFRKLVYLLVLF